MRDTPISLRQVGPRAKAPRALRKTECLWDPDADVLHAQHATWGVTIGPDRGTIPLAPDTQD